MASPLPASGPSIEVMLMIQRSDGYRTNLRHLAIFSAVHEEQTSVRYVREQSYIHRVHIIGESGKDDPDQMTNRSLGFKLLRPRRRGHRSAPWQVRSSPRCGSPRDAILQRADPAVLSGAHLYRPCADQPARKIWTAPTSRVKQLRRRRQRSPDNRSNRCTAKVDRSTARFASNFELRV
jgi:hypothetical protein